MSKNLKFDTKKLETLNNPERLNKIPPAEIWEKLALNEPTTLVDIGAGTGFFSQIFAQLLPNGKIYACDISEIMIEWMNQNLVGLTPNVIPTIMHENRIPLDDSNADLVFMINVHHEMDEPILTLKESYRVLKPAGKIFIVDWKKQKSEQGPPLDIRVTPEEITDHLLDANFSDISVETHWRDQFFIMAQKKQ